jgi:transposase
MELYCGIDLGSTSAQICVIDSDEKVLVQRSVRCQLDKVLEVLAAFERKPKIVIESTFNWYWLVDGLRAAGFDVKLAHVLGLSMITGSKVKTDRRDALALAKLLRLNAIPEAFIYPPEWRAPRDLLRRRLQLVRRRADEYGAIRRLLYRHGVLEHTRQSTTKLNDDRIDELFDEPLVQLHAHQELERVQLYSKQIEVLDDRLLSIASAREDYRRLQTLPGVALILALSILYETGPIERFASAKTYSSYCRVVPGIGQSSGVTRRRGRQSKQGNPFLKSAFSQAATHAVPLRPCSASLLRSDASEAHDSPRQGRGLQRHRSQTRRRGVSHSARRR